MSVKLTVWSPNGGSFDAVFDDPEVRIGRASFCELRLPYQVVSSHHLTVRGDAGDWSVVDEGSTNGTWIDGRRVASGEIVRVRDGLELVIVDVRLEFALVRDYVEGFTLAESGTMLRKMVGEAAAAATADQDLAFVEVVDGPHAGARLYLPDDAEDLTVGSSKSCDLVLRSGPELVATIGRHAEGFRLRAESERLTTPDGQRVDGHVDLASGLQLAVSGGPRVVFFDPLEDYIRQIEREGLSAEGRSQDEATDSPEEQPGESRGLTALEWVLLIFGVVVVIAAGAALVVIVGPW